MLMHNQLCRTLPCGTCAVVVVLLLTVMFLLLQGKSAFCCCRESLMLLDEYSTTHDIPQVLVLFLAFAISLVLIRASTV